MCGAQIVEGFFLHRVDQHGKAGGFVFHVLSGGGSDSDVNQIVIPASLDVIPAGVGESPCRHVFWRERATLLAHILDVFLHIVY